MAIFKCKMCGGALEIGENQSVAICEYCGTKQTLPRLDNEQKVNLYDRANHFRRNNDYYKAMAIYENILNTDTTDAEAYWSILLCRFGVEYVEDPSTHKQVPTINRAQFTSVFADEDYKSAIEYASPEQKEIYKQEAAYIDEVQKGILEISNKEEPFDVFICYKETDSNGRRTRDSVLATELYHGLVNEGFKVFFSRITLEDKLGQEYEPYIFAALNSARVMVVIGTRPEHFNAVWVKNEWSRYLSLVKKSNGQKILIPAYKDMDPYDLPGEFSHLQAQDMNKLGFMQDLIRGIKKIAAPKVSVKETVIINNESNANINALLKRVFMFLEDGEWDNANDYCEKVLDIDPECAEAYLGKLMVDLKIRNKKGFDSCFVDFEENKNYKKIIIFGDENIKLNLKENLLRIKSETYEIELKEKEKLYVKAIRICEHSQKLEDIEWAEKIFRDISGYKDSDIRIKKCSEKYEKILNESVYQQALENIKNKEYSEAIEDLMTIPDWKDSKKLIDDCKEKLFKIENKKTNKQNIALAVIGIIFLLAFLIIFLSEI